MFLKHAALLLGMPLIWTPTAVNAQNFYADVFNGAAAMGGAYMSNAPMPAPIVAPSPVMAPAPMVAPAPVQQQTYHDPFQANRPVDYGGGASSPHAVQTISPQQLQMMQQNQVHLQPQVQHVQPQVQYQPQVMRAPVTGFHASPRPAIVPRHR